MYEIDKSKFGAFISELRKAKGLTQKELAERLFISDKAISKWETGHSVPDITLLVPLSEILDVTVTELLECHRIEKEAGVDVTQMDDVVKKVIHLSEEEKYNRPQIERKNIVFFILCVIISLLELFGLYQLEHVFYFVIPVFTGVIMAMFFGIYFCYMKAFDLKREKIKLASKLYQVRNELGIKQADLQKEGLISQSHLSKIENAEMNISAIMLYHIAKRYGKDINYFLE